MRLHILGCGDAFGSGGRNQSGYLIEASDRLFLLDCGPTSLLALKRAGFDPSRLDAVLLTHLHGDHYGGLPFLFIEYIHQTPRPNPLLIAGPTGTEEKVRALFRLMYGSGRSADLPAEFQILEPDLAATVCGIEVFSFRVPHQEEETSLALKVAYQGKTIVFSGDTAWSERLFEEARGADLFLCECSYYDQGAGKHLSYLKLRDKLPQLGSKQVILTHMGEEMLARRGELEFDTAEDGRMIEF